MVTWTEAATRSTYDEVANTYADHFRGTEPEQPPELAMIEHFVRLLPPSPTVLDAGCGAGRMFPLLASTGGPIIGADLSPAMAARAHVDHPNIPVVAASMRALPFRPDCFDAYFSWYSTIHGPLHHVEAMVAEARRVLRVGGMALFAFQTGAEAKDVASGYRARGHEVQLMRWGRSLATMSSVLESADFTIVTSMTREAVGTERDGQAVILARV